MARAKHRSKKRRSTALVLSRRAPHPKPVIIRTTKVIKAKHKHRRGGGGGGGLGLGKLFSDKRMQVAAAGLAVGFLEKQPFYAQIPALPFIGKKGTIAVASLIIGGKLAEDVGTAALLLAAYELGNTGKVSGDYVAGEHEGIGYVAGY
jgi:hypothetical protein